MAPAIDRYSVSNTIEFNATIGVVMSVGFLVSSMLVWMICGCGGKKKEEEAPKDEEKAPEPSDPSIGKGAEASAKAPASEAPETAAASAAPNAKDPTAKSKSPQGTPDKTSGPKGGGPELKRIGVPMAGAVSGDNQAYATLINESQFKATQKGGAASPKGAGADKVAGSNPAYMTIMNDQNFDPSTKGKATSVVKTVGAGGTTTKGAAKSTQSMTGATAMAGPTAMQTNMKTAKTISPGDTTKK